MSAWIGLAGSLIEFKCPSAVDVSTEDPNVYFRGIGGNVSITRLGTNPAPRVWEVGVSAATPTDAAPLEALTGGEFGPGPFVFIPPAAPSLNLLGRADAMAQGAPGAAYVRQGPGDTILTSEGYAGSSYAATGTTTTTMSMGAVPVLPGLAVTGRAWVQPRSGGAGSVQLLFKDAAGASLGTSAAVTTTAFGGEFIHTTGTAPAGAATVELQAAGLILTRPQITWTPDPRPWAPSAASQQVVTSPLSTTVLRATSEAGAEQITSHQFTVQELTA